MTKKDEVPTTIRVYDEFGGVHDLDKESKLWEEALKFYQQGADAIKFPLSVIQDAMEWGWWTCFQTQQQWVATCEVPMPTHQMLYGLSDASPGRLREMLQEFGGHAAWLEAQIGVMEGRRGALKQSYEAAILVASAQEKGKGTEKSKEAAALAESETLRQTKRMQIEQETVIATAKGMLDAYVRAYEATSRTVTIVTTESGLASGRHS